MVLERRKHLTGESSSESPFHSLLSNFSNSFSSEELARSYYSLSCVGALVSMASPPCLLFRPRPPLCSRRRLSSRFPYRLCKQSLHLLPSSRTCRHPVVAVVAEQLVPRLTGTRRRMGATGFACHCSYDTENGLPTPSPDKVREL